MSTQEFYFLFILLPIPLQREERASSCMVAVASCQVKPRQILNTLLRPVCQCQHMALAHHKQDT